MGVHPPSRAAAATLAAAPLLVCASFTPAAAASTAQAASAALTASSASWGAVATTNTTAPYGTGTLVLPFPNMGTNGQPSFLPQFFTIGNTGTLAITAADYTATSSPTSVALVIESCSTGWNETANTCSAAPATVLTTATSPRTSSNVPTGAGQAIRLRATLTGTVPKNTTPSLTVGISVTRAQTRAATTTGS